MVGSEQRQVVGRRVELGRLAGVLEQLTHGPASAVVLGEAGMGKTTVWRRGIERAEENGVRVLSTRPAEAEARLGYAGLSDLLREVDEDRFDALADVQRRALDIALLRIDAGEVAVDPRAVATAALSLLTHLAATGPVLLAVDDAQWLDRATAGALAYALRRLKEARVGVLATVRAEDRRPRTFVDSLPVESRFEVTLGPLSVAAIHAILQAELECTLPRPTLVKVVAASGGNPFHALEIVRELDRLDERAPDGSLPVPRDLRVLVRRRLGRLPAETREALLTVSCLRVAPIGLIAEGKLDPAEDAGIVRVASDGRVEFTHPLLAAAVYESAPAAGLRATHRRLARLVADPEERARHLALGSSGPDAEVAGELDGAARLARARGAPATAAELAELALDLSPDSVDADTRAERLLVAAAFHFEAGDLVRSKALLERVRDEAPAGPARARALRLLGQLHGRRSNFGEALALALDALATGPGDPGLVTELELDAAYYRFSLGDFERARAHAGAAVRGAETAANPGLVASALAVRAVVEFLGGNGLAEADMARALAAADPVEPVPLVIDPRFINGLLQLWTGRAGLALETLDDMRREALTQGRESEVPLAYLYLVWACLWSGDVTRAATLAEQGRETASLLDDHVSNALALSACALANAYQARVEQARSDAASALELFGRLQWLSGTIWALWALGFLELSLEDAAAAHATLEPLAAVALGGDPVLCVFLPDEIDALVRLGRVDEAEALLAPFEDRSRTLERAWALAAAARCRGQILAARADLEGALAALEEALTYHDAQSMPFERARTLLELGRLQRRRKQKRLARIAIEESLAVFESIGTPLWAEQARGELARAATRRAAAGLTATEERIAQLAAEGLTNRAIAERAFVSVNTVEANLKRAYRKLGISSRAQLARALDRQNAQTIS